MWLNQDSLARSLIYATSTPEVPSTYIHPFPSPEPPKNIITHCPEYCYSLSLKGFNAEEAWVMQKKRRIKDTRK